MGSDPKSVPLVAAVAALAMLAVAGSMAAGSTPSRAAADCGGHRPTIVGTGGDDQAPAIVGTPKRDVIVGKDGNDEIFSMGGADIICGGEGNDGMRGGGGRDRIFGGPGADILRGGGGKDRIQPGPGDDLCLSIEGDAVGCAIAR
jgi:Ca2+-binding RTX toxin-like protein